MTEGLKPFNSKKVCLFGAGSHLLDGLEQIRLFIGRNPDLICDNAATAWGRELCGCKVMNPETLRDQASNLTFIITARAFEGIAAQLESWGAKDIRIACFDRALTLIRSIRPLAKGLKSPCELPDPAGRWALITGGTRGIGFEIAKALAALKVNLVIHGRSSKTPWPGENELHSHGVSIDRVSADLSQPKDVDALIKALDQKPLDFLFNNAGISSPDIDQPWSFNTESYLRHYLVNAIAPIRLAAALLPGMKTRGFGRIVNISSTIQRRPGDQPYACSKAALDKFVHDCAPSLDGSGVAMSLVCPGHVRSEMGGSNAPHPLESVCPGALLGALMSERINGRWIIAQDYAGLTLKDALAKAAWYLDLDGACHA